MPEKSNTEKGRQAEEIVLDYLIKSGYMIKEMNWRSGKAEIDLIAGFEDFLIFIEVKSRKKSAYGSPEWSVNQRKKDLLASAAASYLRATKYEGNFRFDIVTLVFRDSNNFTLEHYRDAFFPGL